MPTPKSSLPYLQREVARGKAFWYVRCGRGARIRIHGEYGSNEFVANYNAAMGGEKLRTNPSVYFILVGNAIKIGTSKNVIKRARALQTGQSGRVQIIHTIPGGIKLEASLHKQFKDSHVRGEWFYYAGQIAKYIDGCKHAA